MEITINCPELGLLAQAIALLANSAPEQKKALECPPVNPIVLEIQAADQCPDEKPIVVIEDIRKLMTDLTRSKGKDTAKGLLKQFNAEKLSDIPKDKYADLAAAIKGVS